MTWRLYYDEGTVVVGSTQAEWDRAAVDGVLFVAHREADEQSWEVNSVHEFYFLHDGALGYTRDLGPLIRKLRFVKFGRWASPERMNAVRRAVEADCGVTMEAF